MMNERQLRRALIMPQPDLGELWYCEATPAAALAEAVAAPELAALAPVERPEAEVLDALETLQRQASAADVIGQAELGESLEALLNETGAQVHGSDDLDDDAPVIRMINAILVEASAVKASDIHLEPYEKSSVVRFRVDGILRDVAHPPRALHAALISRIKVMAQLDIAEKRLPQDGRMTIRGAGGMLDLRVSTLPTGHGERAVLRLLDKGQGPLSLEALGMAPDTLQRFEALIRKPYGIVLVTGPTGSGKTTTLYAALARMDSATQNIMTVEDPIEYEMVGISQTQVLSKIGLTFAQTLRAQLRQDPDVILIGEIRDLETAQIAIQASLTGHLVLATLHTNDSASAVTRLVDMGVEPFLLSSSLLGVLAQRLVRRVCPSCHGQEPAVLSCSTCGQSGFQGRMGIYELMLADDGVRAAIKDRADANELRAIAQRQGLRTLREDGLRLVAAGKTTEAELARVTQLEDDALLSPESLPRAATAAPGVGRG